MPVRLFHRTSDEAAAVILVDGFRDHDTDGDGQYVGVWFSRWLDCMGEKGDTLLEVLIDLPAAELATYNVGAAFDEEWDDKTNTWIKSEPEPVDWFLIPAALVNGRGTVRLVPRDEDRALRKALEFGDD
jgi:hypothetical protein